MSNQNGIVKAYEPMVVAIIALAYNLLAGGVIGVLGSIYYLVFVRGFIMENRSRFLAMETANLTQNNINAQDPNIIYTSMVLTEREANNGVQKEIYIADLQTTLKVCVPKNIKAGQALMLRKVKGTDQSGKTIKKQVYIKISIE